MWKTEGERQVLMLNWMQMMLEQHKRKSRCDRMIFVFEQNVLSNVVLS
jgi:hypothetical protein